MGFTNTLPEPSQSEQLLRPYQFVTLNNEEIEPVKGRLPELLQAGQGFVFGNFFFITIPP